MRLSTNIIVLAAVVAGSLASPAPSSHILHEKRSTGASRGWSKRSKLDAEAKLPVRIGLTQSNLDIGHQLLMDVASHDSKNYGKHYSSEEVIELFAPAESTVTAVKNWLQVEGISADRITLSTNKQWLQFNADAKELESLLLTEYHVFEHGQTGKKTVACDEYHIPQAVQKHIDYITPGIKLMPPRGKSETRDASLPVEKRGFMNSQGARTKPIDRLRERPERTKAHHHSDSPNAVPSGTANCDTEIIPDCIKALYNITDPPTTVSSNNSLGIFECTDWYTQADLNDFFTNVFPTIPSGTHPTLNSIDGATAPAPNIEFAFGESDLDFQISYPLIYPQTIQLFQSDDDHYEEDYEFDGFFNNFLDAIDGSYCTFSFDGETGNSAGLDPTYPDKSRSGGFTGDLQCGVFAPTNVISFSYEVPEAALPPSYVQRQCQEYMKLGLQGVSLVFASGDAGVGSSEGCIEPITENGGEIFAPNFPSSCPFVTSVGGTVLPPGADVFTDSEVAVTRFPSGGGFSNVFGIPDYQTGSVATFFDTADVAYPSYATLNETDLGANGGIYNTIGRGIPDVAATGDNVLVFVQGEEGLIGGTSAATPLFGAILTRINEERIAAGKSTIGFVNPVLYANPTAFHDITNGSNAECNTDGFSCVVGWDPVTGLGTPNYPVLLSVFMALP